LYLGQADDIQEFEALQVIASAKGGHGYFRSRLVRAETAAEIPSGGGEDNVQIERNAEAEVVCAALLALHELDENVYARNCTSTLR